MVAQQGSLHTVRKAHNEFVRGQELLNRPRVLTEAIKASPGHRNLLKRCWFLVQLMWACLQLLWCLLPGKRRAGFFLEAMANKQLGNQLEELNRCPFTVNATDSLREALAKHTRPVFLLHAQKVRTVVLLTIGLLATIYPGLQGVIGFWTGWGSIAGQQLATVNLPPSVLLVAVLCMYLVPIIAFGYALAGVMSALLLVVARKFDASAMRHYPEAFAAQTLLTIHPNTKQPLAELTPQERQALLAKLELVARCIDYHRVRRYRSGDVATDRRHQQEMAEIAAGVRELKEWVLVPYADTHIYLRNRIVAILQSVLLDDWHALERRTPVVISSRVRAITWLQKLLPSLLVGAIPLCIVGLIDVSNLQASTMPMSLLWVFSFGWMSFRWCAALDPEFKPTLDAFFSAVKQIRDVFRP